MCGVRDRRRKTWPISAKIIHGAVCQELLDRHEQGHHQYQQNIRRLCIETQALWGHTRPRDSRLGDNDNAVVNFKEAVKNTAMSKAYSPPIPRWHRPSNQQSSRGRKLALTPPLATCQHRKGVSAPSILDDLLTEPSRANAAPTIYWLSDAPDSLPPKPTRPPPPVPASRVANSGSVSVAQCHEESQNGKVHGTRHFKERTMQP